MNRREFLIGLGTSTLLLSTVTLTGLNTWTPVMKANEKNLNGRLYPTKALKTVVDTSIKLISENRCLITVNNNESLLNLNNVAGQVTDIKLAKHILYAKYDILNTPKGKYVKDILDANLSLYITTAGMGEIDENGVISNYVFSHFMFTLDSAWDI